MYIGVDTYQSSVSTETKLESTLVCYYTVLNAIGVDKCQFSYSIQRYWSRNLSVFLQYINYVGVDACLSSCSTLTTLESTLWCLLAVH